MLHDMMYFTCTIIYKYVPVCNVVVQTTLYVLYIQRVLALQTTQFLPFSTKINKYL